MPNPDPGLPPLPAKWAEPDPDAPARLERALNELTGQQSAPGYASSGIWQYDLRDESGCRGEHPDG